MASLRDVFDHAGKKVRIVADDGTEREGLAIRRESTLLLEPKLAPQVGDTVLLLETSEPLRVLRVSEEHAQGRVDHYRVDVEAVVG